MRHSQPKTHADYTVGWICGLAIEQTTATALLDERHEDLPNPPGDSNAYTLGRVLKHNVVIACLPQGVIGTNAAARVATLMVQAYTNVKFGLMVGNGGGVPPKVRLGDVVVSTPVGKHPGVVQWDLGKAIGGGKFKETGVLNKPPDILLTALSKLETANDIYGSGISDYLTAFAKVPNLAQRFTWSKRLKDPLCEGGRDFSTSADEKMGNTGPTGEKGHRSEEDMCVHFGLIGSGNQVIKDAKLRDALNERYDGELLCVEMEAAGFLDKFPCLVIRGISNYANEEKNDDWQDYAAARAAGFAKELLHYVPPAAVDRASAAKDIAGILDQVDKIQVSVSRLEDELAFSRKRVCQRETKEILDWLTPVDYGPTQSDYFSRRQDGTGSWFLDSEEFQAWLNTNKTTLFCPGVPGAGKTIVTSIVIDYLKQQFGLTPKVGIAYIYCNYERQHDQGLSSLLLSLLKQLAAHLPSLPQCIEDLYSRHNKKKTTTRPSLDEIATPFRAIMGLHSRVFVLIDALDECHAPTPDRSRSKLLEELFHLQKTYNINIFATSRHIPEINEHFKAAMLLEIRANDNDVVKYLDDHIDELPSFVKEDMEVRTKITEAIAEAADGVFLLAVLYIRLLADKMTLNQLQTAIASFRDRNNQSRDEQSGGDVLHIAYKAAMDRIETQMPGRRELARNVLLWTSCAKRRLSPKALQDALATRRGTTTISVGDRPAIADMVSVCAGLVTVDERSQIIRLAHYTTQEYFSQTREHWFTKPDERILEICMTNMSSNLSLGYPVDRPEINSLSTYARFFFTSHLPKDPEAAHKAMNFFYSEYILDKAARSIHILLGTSEDTEFYAALRFRLAEISKTVLDLADAGIEA